MKLGHFYFLLLLYGTASAQSPYKLDWKKEIGIYSVGGASLIYGSSTNSNIKPLSIAQIQLLNPNDIHPFDRATIQNNSSWAGTVSDYGVYSLMLSPLAFMSSETMRKDWQTLGILYSEVILLSTSLPNWTKNSVQRLRPFVYNPEVELDKKMERDAQRSFFSSHTCVAFSAATFFSSVYSSYYPHSKLKPFVWTSSLLAASTVGYMRYQSGNHYPSDILIGAAVGTGVGLLIPYFHRVHKNKALTILPQASDRMVGISLRYQL